MLAPQCDAVVERIALALRAVIGDVEKHGIAWSNPVAQLSDGAREVGQGGGPQVESRQNRVFVGGEIAQQGIEARSL